MNSENVETIALIMKLMSKGVYKPFSSLRKTTFDTVKSAAEKETGKKLTFTNRYSRGNFINRGRRR